jgi:hypothetical protein
MKSRPDIAKPRGIRFPDREWKRIKKCASVRKQPAGGFVRIASEALCAITEKEAAP